jgi:uncharacterized protein with PQ loop repeat
MYKFKELEGFGFNFLTMIFLITLFFIILQLFALIKQNRRILKNKSGESVSFMLFSFWGFAGIALIFYGIYISSLSITLSGFLGFMNLSISTNLLKFKKISLKEKVGGALSFIVVPLMIFSNQKDLLVLIFGLIIQFFIILQIMELWKSPNSGAIHPIQAITSIFSGTFWLIYCVLMNIWLMVISNIIGVSLYTILILIYLKKTKPCLK